MSKLAAFFASVSSDVAANFRAGYVPVVRGKASAKALEAAGFKMEKVSAQYYQVSFDDVEALRKEFYAHGPAVSVVRIDGKYCESMGAYEVLIVADAEGKEFSVGNKYDTSACFRDMSTVALIEYANKAAN